jgi:hypothetical protein
MIFGAGAWREGAERLLGCWLGKLVDGRNREELLGARILTFLFWTCCLRRSLKNSVEAVCVFTVGLEGKIFWQAGDVSIQIRLYALTFHGIFE